MTTTTKNLYKVYKSGKNTFSETMKVLRITGNEETSYLLRVRKSVEKSINNTLANEMLSIVVVNDLACIKNMVNTVIGKILIARGYEEEVGKLLMK